MKLITFQPRGWYDEPEKDYTSWRDGYLEEMGFPHGVWCIAGETLKAALIDIYNIQPMLPEVCVFLTATKWAAVDKPSHYRWIGDDDCKQPGYVMRSDVLRKQLSKDCPDTPWKECVKDVLFNKVEFVVRKRDIKIVEEVDICEVVDNFATERNDVDGLAKLRAENRRILDEAESYLNSFDTDELKDRAALSDANIVQYCFNTDLFIRDYGRIFGLSDDDIGITGEVWSKAIEGRAYRLFQAFDENPSKETLNRYVNHLRERIDKLRDKR